MKKLLVPLIVSMVMTTSAFAGDDAKMPVNPTDVSPSKEFTLPNSANSDKTTSATGKEVQQDPNAAEFQKIQGHPLTSVVVTQCNLIVAVYVTLRDGRLLRFDSSAKVSADQLLQMAYSADRSERVEVSCNSEGAQGFEKHDPV